MALQITTNINVDFYDNKYIMIYAKQYDDRSRLISITCYNNGNLYNLSAKNHTAYVKYRKADGHLVLNSCPINYKGEILVELTEQMLAASGICYVDLLIVNKGSAMVNVDTGSIITIDGSSILTTKAFCIDVQEAVVDNSLIESSDEYDGLVGLLEMAEASYANVIQNAKSWAVGTGNDARENDEQDNSKYYSRLSKSYAIGDAGGIRTNENRDNSKYYSEQASNSANAADTSEANALSYMNNANEYMNDAKSHMDNAEAYMNSAKTYMDNAFISEQNALVSEQNATTSESNASVSESNASISEQNAKTSETNAYNSKQFAQSYAVGGTGFRTNEDTDNSKYYCEKALESASNIEADADIISNAATLASSSALNAANSAEDAGASADIATNSAENAVTSANAALTSANNAANSAEAAGISESNSHTYYLQVEEMVTGLSGAFMPMGTIEFAELKTLFENGEISAGHLYNISDNFITDENFERGAGIEYAAGTNVYLTSNGHFDCLVGTTVTGVKGQNETEYRKGNVNLTAENIGAVSIVDVATVDEVTNYLGI